MRVLAIETSCDDTCAAVVEGGNAVLSNVRKAQTAHANWGGVVPELAARQHAADWRGVVEAALAAAQTTMEGIDQIVVSVAPGLMGSLLVGVQAAMHLGALWSIPVQPVHHIWGHVASVCLGRNPSEIKLPALCLTISGGHTQLLKIDNWTTAKMVAETRDDACGEAFDKVAKMLGLTYPGGPVVSQLAKAGNPETYTLPHPLRGQLDFSFSGLKAAVYRHLQGVDEITETVQKDICAAFQVMVVEVFTKRIEAVFDLHPDAQQLWFVGGVSANTQLRDALENLCAQHQKELLLPVDFAYCTDNAAMMAAAAWHQKDAVKLQIAPMQPNPKLSMDVADLASVFVTVA